MDYLGDLLSWIVPVLSGLERGGESETDGGGDARSGRERRQRCSVGEGEAAVTQDLSRRGRGDVARSGKRWQRCERCGERRRRRCSIEEERWPHRSTGRGEAAVALDRGRQGERRGRRHERAWERGFPFPRS